MRIISANIQLDTSAGVSVVNITKRIMELLEDSNINNGQLTVFTCHTTTGIAINECEERLQKDILVHFEIITPKVKHYMHDDISLRDCPANERKNGDAHIKAIGMSTSQTIPIQHGKLLLGRWQSILFFDFDGARKREIIIQVLGE